MFTSQTNAGAFKRPSATLAAALASDTAVAQCKAEIMHHRAVFPHETCTCTPVYTKSRADLRIERNPSSTEHRQIALICFDNLDCQPALQGLKGTLGELEKQDRISCAQVMAMAQRQAGRAYHLELEGID